jgi:hypothetical protein
MEKIAANEIIGHSIVDLLCTHPDSDKHPYVATYLLQLDNDRCVAIGSGSIHQVDAAEVKSVELFQHRLAKRLRKKPILSAVCCESASYDQTFLIVDGPSRIANCTIATERMLFLRESFDETYERDVEYWNYFTGAPVDFLGNPRHGSLRRPFRVSWV